MSLELDEFCPCCKYNTFEKGDRLNYSICPICFWEDDTTSFENPEYAGGANRVSLIEAQRNFEEFGACQRDMIKNTKKPNKRDIRKENQNRV